MRASTPGSPPPPGAPAPPGAPVRVGRAAALAGAASLFGRVTGLLREAVFAAYFGAGMAADAYNAAFRVPGLFRELLAEGSLSNVYVPLFAETSEREGLERAWRMANAVLGALLLVLGLVTLLFLAFARPFVMLVAGGFAEVPGKVGLAAWLTRLLSPFLAGLSIASLFGGMLNVRGRFFLPALAPALLNLFVIAGCVFGGAWERWTGRPAIGAVALGATLSGLATAAIQYPLLRREGFRLRPRLERHPALERMVRFMGAALVGIVVVQFSLLVETQLASRAGQGAVSWLVYGFRLVQLPQGVVASSVAVAALAGLSVLLAREDRAGARALLARGLEINSLLILPAAVGLYVLSDDLIRILFERGAFRPEDTAATAAVLRMYALATTGICVYRVLLPVFFALKDPYLPMKLSLAVMVSKVPLALGFMRLLGVPGLPLSHAATVTFEVTVMTWVLGRRMGGWAEGFWSQQVRIAAAALGMGAVVAAARGPLLGALGPLAGPLAAVALGAGVYGAAVLALRVREARSLLRRGLRRRPPPPPPGVPPAGGPPPPGPPPP